MAEFMFPNVAYRATVFRTGLIFFTSPVLSSHQHITMVCLSIFSLSFSWITEPATGPSALNLILLQRKFGRHMFFSEREKKDKLIWENKENLLLGISFITKEGWAVHHGWGIFATIALNVSQRMSQHCGLKFFCWYRRVLNSHRPGGYCKNLLFPKRSQ